MDLPKLEDIKDLPKEELEKLIADIDDFGEAVFNELQSRVEQVSDKMNQEVAKVYGAEQTIQAKLADQYKTHIESIKIIIGLIGLAKLCHLF